jgi:hypothetical protein
MTPAAQQLLDAHVAFELQQLEGKALQNAINEEVAVLWKWLGKTNIADVLPKKEVKAFVERNKNIAITEPVKEYILSLVADSREFVEEKDWEVGDILHKKHYDALVDRLLEMEDARNELIGRVVKNPFYADLIANILYNGIKSFTQEGGALQKSPVGGLFKLGQGLMQASGLEDAIDTNVKKFISANLQKTLSQNEKYLKEKLSNTQLKKLSNNAWDKVSDFDLKNITKHVKPSRVEKSLPIAEEYWNEVVASKAFNQSVDFVLDHFYKANGKKKVAEVLGDLTITEEKAALEAYHAALPWIAEMKQSGYLEARIRARMEKFYSAQGLI